MDTPDDDHVLFSRMANGKRSSRIEARVQDDLKMDLVRKCHQLGFSESEYIERLVMVSLYGMDHVLTVERQKTEMVCGLSAKSPEARP